MRLSQVRDGETVKPKMDGFLLQCCGCGLTHKLVFRVRRVGRANHVEFTIRRVH